MTVKRLITPEERQYMIENSSKHTIREMQDILSLKKQNIQYFLNKNNLTYRQHPDCKYKNPEGIAKIDFDNCPILGFKYWN